MNPTLVAAGIVVVLVGTEAFFTVLEVLNLRHQEATVAVERDWVVEELGINDPEEALAYERVQTGVSALRSWLGLAAVLAVLFTGIFADAVAVAEGLGLSTFQEGLVSVAGAVVAIQLWSIPFDLVETFVVEEVFGFNNQTLGLWVRDTLVGTLVGLVFVVPLAGAVLWFVGNVPVWPAAAWALLVAFTVAFTVIKPRVIDPLFNDFSPIEEGELRAAVDEVFDRAGYQTDEVYEMDASRRSSHSNAYFTGFGPAKRVVLFDTLVESIEPEELQGVLAHELAHWREGHIWKFVVLSAVQFAVIFAALGVLVETPALYAAVGTPQLPYVGLGVGLLVVGPVTRLTSPVQNYFSLAYEREADAYAVEVVGGEEMAGALAQLTADNLSTPFPHPWYETFHYDHPPVPERIRRVRELDPEVEREATGEDLDAAGAD